MTDVPPTRQCTLPSCEREAVEAKRSGKLCAHHREQLGEEDNAERVRTSEGKGTEEIRKKLPDSNSQNSNAQGGSGSGGTSSESEGVSNRDKVLKQRDCHRAAGEDIDRGGWNSLFLADPERRTYPRPQYDLEYWMGAGGTGGKQPFAIWGDRDAPAECNKDGHTTADECDCDARWKWGYRGHYRDGADAELALADPEIEALTYILHDDEPTMLVDGDKVVDPDSGAVHPRYLELLARFGLTYADISLSETGTHAIYQGTLTEGVKQATWELDDKPWGANDEPPSIEIYDHGRVCVMTGKHVPGTPTEAREIDADALEAILDEHDQLPTPNPTGDVPTARETYDFDDHDPKATASDETTDDIKDIFAALERLDAQAVAEKTIVYAWNDDASTSDGKRAFVPTWGPSANGTANIVDDRVWQDTGGGGYGGPVVMALIDSGEMSHRNASPRDATGEAWWKGVDHLRELGFAIPEYEPGEEDPDPVAVLPTAVRDLTTAASEWDWRNTGADEQRGLSIDDARERTTGAITDAYENGDRVLVEALPTMGKSYGAVKAAAETGEQITILTGRGRKEQYDQIREWCDEQSLGYYTLPAFTHDCDTANGENGEKWASTVRDWYRRGATPKEIHKSAEYVLDRPLPCQEHDGHQCPYASKWDFDPDDHDVLIGHYNHAYKSKVSAGRVCVFDEFPDAYETTLGSRIQEAVSYWLSTVDGVPFEDYTDLIENRKSDDARRADALLWFEDQGVEPDETQVFDDKSAHATTPLVVFALLSSDDLGNGFESADLGDIGTGVFNRGRGEVSILRPPQLKYASGIVALDGTPTREMWEFSLGQLLNHRPVLTEDERREYIRDVLGLQLVRTTDAVKSYSPKESAIEKRVSVREDAALLEAIGDEHGEKPALITTRRAEDVYEEEGLLDLADSHQHYGNILGSNRFAQQRLGAVFGSRNYGPDYVKKWGAYLDETIEPIFPGPENGFEPTDYGAGNKIRTHMREHETLQAAMRFGRDGKGATVYVHTDTLPDWVPVAGEGRVLSTWSDGRKQVLEAARDLGEWTTAELAAHSAVEITERQVRTHLTDLVNDGVLDRETEGCGWIWRDDGLHRVSDHGDVELEPVDLVDLTAEESAEVARSSYYRWHFRTSASSSDGSDSAADEAPRITPQSAVTGGDPPPDGSA